MHRREVMTAAFASALAVVVTASTIAGCSTAPVDLASTDAPVVRIGAHESEAVPDEVRAIPGFVGVLETGSDLRPATSASHDLPGDRGTVEIKKPGWWREWDGVAPETPGGHTEYPAATDATCGGATGAEFGEYCDGGLLVESNPDSTSCHFHNGGVGHPYVFNCNEYCQGTNRASGSCEAANATSPYTGKVIASAYCKCVAFHTPRTADDVWSIESRF